MIPSSYTRENSVSSHDLTNEVVLRMKTDAQHNLISLTTTGKEILQKGANYNELYIYKKINLPCCPGCIQSITSLSARTALTGITPPPNALPST